MRSINGNASTILTLVQAGEIQVGEIVYSEVNQQAYKIAEQDNHFPWFQLEAVTATN